MGITLNQLGKNFIRKKTIWNDRKNKRSWEDGGKEYVGFAILFNASKIITSKTHKSYKRMAKDRQGKINHGRASGLWNGPAITPITRYW